MCLIIARPAGVDIPLELVKQSVRDNPHGWGIMYPENGQLVIKKGMLANDFIEAVKALDKDRPALIHTRIKTKGEVDIRNNHPFQFNGTTAMMHNGSLDIVIRDQQYSDTWHMAMDVVGPVLTR